MTEELEQIFSRPEFIELIVELIGQPREKKSPCPLSQRAEMTR
jgi:hypothetical protein